MSEIWKDSALAEHALHVRFGKMGSESNKSGVGKPITSASRPRLANQGSGGAVQGTENTATTKTKAYPGLSGGVAESTATTKTSSHPGPGRGAAQGTENNSTTKTRAHPGPRNVSNAAQPTYSKSLIGSKQNQTGTGSVRKPNAKQGGRQTLPSSAQGTPTLAEPPKRSAASRTYSLRQKPYSGLRTPLAEQSSAPSSSLLSWWIPLPVVNRTKKSQCDGPLWSAGPVDSSGVVVDLSDRPLMCMSVRGTEAVIGCADHGVYVVDVSAQKLQRNLYSKKYGHVDWVTCVDFLPDGRIISGAMDKMLCLWDAIGVRCTTLTGHSASISAVKVIDNKYALSASYDKTMMLWDLNRSTEVGCLQGHRGAVLAFAVNSEGGIVSGSREGEVFLWDGRDGKAVLRFKTAHKGHVTAVDSFTDTTETFLSGGQDGVLRVWDRRSKTAVQTVALSRSAKGKGAITNIAITSVSPGAPPLVIAASADQVIRIIEPRSSFQILRAVDDHTDFIYSLHTDGSLMWSGAGNGNLLVHDLTDGRCLYGLGATNNGAVRCVSLVGPRDLVAAGDDGNCIMYCV